MGPYNQQLSSIIWKPHAWKYLKIGASSDFECKICGEDCMNMKYFQEHKIEEHATAAKFKCEDHERIKKK